MKILISFFLLIQISNGLAISEWQFYVPDQAVEISGINVAPNLPLLIINVDGVEVAEAFDLTGFTSEPLPEHAKITSLAFTQMPLEEVVFSLDVPYMQFKAGVGIKCANGSCEAMIDPQNDLGLPEGVQLDALSWFSNSELNNTTAAISLNQNVSIGNNYYRNKDVLAISFDKQMENPVITNVFFNSDDIEMPIQNNLVGFDLSVTPSEVYFSIVPEYGFLNDQNGFVPQNQITELFDQTIDGSTITSLYADVTGISAYSASNTGWAEWTLSSTSFFEDQGDVTIMSHRFNGKELFQSYTIQQQGGTAIEGVDFQVLTPSLAWINQDGGFQNVGIRILDNNVLGETKTLVLKLVPNSFFALTNSPQDLITISINDNEPFDLIFKDGFD